ncbi:ABC-type Fe3+-sideroPhore transport system, permease component [Sporolactobacillus inulinus]|uniref:ABC-type Fe3+-sideroPhore transport system, permease component n=2 Tax=Sporolactobacillus inulinus TaxID=2078 RepID=A0A4Y1Z916_9BACL|nr:ABC-type Fe3+-sideroPhore transport system, permease component [Sporolactobacillus inulinus]
MAKLAALKAKHINQSIKNSRMKKWSFPTLLIVGPFLLLFAIGVSISYGATNIDLKTVWDSVFHYNAQLVPHKIIWELRMPRVLGSVIIGACFSVSGALMQGVTRNPLADSGILGINAGAAFVLALCYAFFPALPFFYLMICSFIGAGVGAGIVYGMSSLSPNGMSPVRLVLAGAAVSALLTALSQGLAIYFQIGQDLAFWYAGGTSGIHWFELMMILPWVIGAFLAALFLSPSITILSLGDNIASGLGMHTGIIKTASIVIVLILAGAAVSVVGAIGFVGLIIPHLTRYLVGTDYRRIIPCTAILGSLLLVLADLGARSINPPYETPIGVLIALIGIPFFLYLAGSERSDH